MLKYNDCSYNGKTSYKRVVNRGLKYSVPPNDLRS